MLLRRLGNKRKLAHDIIRHFPDHSTYIEPFFGAGGLFFSKRPAKYNFINDLDGLVFNLFKVIMERPHELRELLEVMPEHQMLFNYFKTQEYQSEVLKAFQFLYLSSHGFMGTPNTMRLQQGNTKSILLKHLDWTIDFFRNENVQLFNVSFEDLYKVLTLREKPSNIFVYNDPPYVDTKNTYASGKRQYWREDDLRKLVDVMKSKPYKFAISEFENDITKQVAADYELNIIPITERRNVRGREVEIIMTNYYENRLFE